MYNNSGLHCCGTCKFFMPIEIAQEEVVLEEGQTVEDGEIGRCKRYPPTLYHRKLLNGEWPVISQEEWCGEYAVDPLSQCK
jgi:hypothetical protein